MNKQNSKTIFLLLPIGLLLMSSTFVIQHFSKVSDFTDGLLKGVGIGLMLLALLLPKFNAFVCRT
jgi:hypothetical protein